MPGCAEAPMRLRATLGARVEVVLAPGFHRPRTICPRGLVRLTRTTWPAPSWTRVHVAGVVELVGAGVDHGGLVALLEAGHGGHLVDVVVDLVGVVRRRRQGDGGLGVDRAVPAGVVAPGRPDGDGRVLDLAQHLVGADARVRGEDQGGRPGDVRRGHRGAVLEGVPGSDLALGHPARHRGEDVDARGDHVDRAVVVREAGDAERAPGSPAGRSGRRTVRRRRARGRSPPGS